MNNGESAKKGFRTFILTLSVSLIVFSAVFYVLTTYSSDKNPVRSTGTEVAVEQNVVGNEAANVQGAKDEREGEKTVFGDIVSKKPTTKPQEVLAGATSAPSAQSAPQSTSSVPETGYTEMTIGLLLSLALFVGAMIYNSKNPRKMALSSFEKDVLKKSK